MISHQVVMKDIVNTVQDICFNKLGECKLIKDITRYLKSISGYLTMGSIISTALYDDYVIANDTKISWDPRNGIITVIHISSEYFMLVYLLIFAACPYRSCLK